MTSYIKKRSLSRFWIYFFLVILSLISFLPFYLMIVNATHSSMEIASRLNYMIGGQLLNNYKALVRLTNIWKGFSNSLFIGVCYTVLSAYFGAMVAYGFAKFRFRGRNVLLVLVLVSMMIPQQLGVIGLYQLCLKTGLLNNFLPLFITGVCNATTVFFLQGYIKTSLPDSIIEAARIEGCSEIRIFNRIVLPCISPAVATMSIFNFVYSWNNYLQPLILIYTKDKYPMPVLIAMIKGLYLTNYGAMYIAVAISVMPVILIFVCLSRYIINGLTLGVEK